MLSGLGVPAPRSVPHFVPQTPRAAPHRCLSLEVFKASLAHGLLGEACGRGWDLHQVTGPVGKGVPGGSLERCSLGHGLVGAGLWAWPGGEGGLWGVAWGRWPYGRGLEGKAGLRGVAWWGGGPLGRGLVEEAGIPGFLFLPGSSLLC